MSILINRKEEIKQKGFSMTFNDTEKNFNPFETVVEDMANDLTKWVING